MKKIVYLFLLLTFCKTSIAQEKEICDCPNQSKKGKGSFYFAWGYNRDKFSKSDLHFKNTSTSPNATTKAPDDSYDFTVYDAEARDRSNFCGMLREDLTIPQYNYRLGYYFNDKKDLGIEINFDHVKYVVRDWQTLHVTGTIHGQYIDKDTLINPNNFLHFEHSDGANFLFLDFVKRQRLLVSKNKKHWLSGVVKVGAGVMIPRTDVTIFGQELNNCFHLAGYGGGIEAGLRYDFFKHFYLEFTGKGAYTNYTNVLVIGPGKAHHYFYTAETILVLGLQFPL